MLTTRPGYMSESTSLDVYGKEKKEMKICVTEDYFNDTGCCSLEQR